jgi:hypothetical protein
MIEPGTYTARAKELAFITASTGTEGARVFFELEDGRNISWVGWLSDACAARTAESLAICGFDGNDDSTVTRNQVHLVVDLDDPYTNEAGETVQRSRVKWINDPNRAKGIGKPMEPSQALAAKQRLRGLVLASQQKLGAKSALPGDRMPFDSPKTAAVGKPKF